MLITARALAVSAAVSVALVAPAAVAAPAHAATIPGCTLAQLPAQATTTVKLIHAGGPFPYPKNDGVTFRNAEGILPAKASTYYHEYTVPTPGASTRGARRIITGGGTKTNPSVFYYTGDHYASFCRITNA